MNMPALPQNGSKAVRRKPWFRGVFGKPENQLPGLVLLFGAAAALLISGLLLEFKIRGIPEYRIGDIASQQVIAPQELIYEDKEATANRREAARDRTPAVYELEALSIDDLERKIQLAFAAARQALSAQQIPAKGRLTRTQRKVALESLKKEVGQTLSPRFLPLLLDYRFDPELEKRILKVLRPVLRGGIVADPERFRRDAKKAVVLRDKATLTEEPLREASQVRSMEAAKEHLRQFHLEFAELSAPERAELFSLLDTLLIPTLVYNAAETESRRNVAAVRVTPVEVQIKKGRVILRTGEEVTPKAAADLAALRNLHRPKPILERLLGLFFFVAGFLYALWRYLAHFQKSYRTIRGSIALVVMALILGVVVMRLLTGLADILGEHLPIAVLQAPFGLYFMIPFAFAATLVTLLIDLNVGLIVSMIVGAFVGLFYGDIYIAIYAVLGSWAGAYSLVQPRKHSGLFKSGLRIAAVNAMAALAIHLLKQETFIWPELLAMIAIGALSGISAAALVSVSWPTLASWFKITNDIRLLEFSNVNAPLMKRLSVEAPGTYHHSLMVGALSEAAAETIGVNPLLMRAAAYYHDAGKMLKPDYFRENQTAGVNKHDRLPPNISCQILADHVSDGLQLAEQAGITEGIRDLIQQHHGTRLMTYFYQKAKGLAAGNAQDVDEGAFRYPGPKPQSKEAAILMMADSIEAASRTLSDPSTLELQGMVNRLIDDILADRQLDECDLTIREIYLLRESFLRGLTGIHHRRVEYPGYDFTLGQGTGLQN
jgi:putative nucleotidyltransferase with HDIG domain